MKTPEYREGPEALESFKKLATAIFQAPKSWGRKVRKKSSKTATKSKPKKLKDD
jgi:hypothetical protein